MKEITLALNYEGLEFEVTYEPDKNGQPRPGWYIIDPLLNDLVYDYHVKSGTQARFQEFIRTKIYENCRK